jgi:hypothetical protein
MKKILLASITFILKQNLITLSQTINGCLNANQYPTTIVNLATTEFTQTILTPGDCNYSGDYVITTNWIPNKRYTITSLSRR